MNIKYFYEFKGLDEVLNRVEILCPQVVYAKEIMGASNAFILEYPTVKKLETVQTSGAEIGIISKSVLQFTDLHTENMQGYQVRLYRNSILYWIGWLDSELYSENLSLYPPYPVKFSSADFNILERLKFTDLQDRKFTDITTLLQQLKRCFNKLNLPFSRLYIGCSTIPQGITLTSSETALHKLYIQSSNFYDEDGEAMTCRKAVEAILDPFGLMIIQRDASVYIYDYNAIKTGSVMKCYNFETLAYIGDTAVDTILGNLPEIGFSSDSSTFEYEEMINNVSITSSLYAPSNFFEASIKLDTLSDKWPTVDYPEYKTDLYYKDKNMENVQGQGYLVYTEKGSDNTLIGAEARYTPVSSSTKVLYRSKTYEYLIKTNKPFFINIQVKIYLNTRLNPFDEDQGKVEESNTVRYITVPCLIYIIDESGHPTMYYSGLSAQSDNQKWVNCQNGSPDPEASSLFFSDSKLGGGHIFNTWVANANTKRLPYDDRGEPETTAGQWFDVSNKAGKGVNIPIPSQSGTLVFEILNNQYVSNGYWPGVTPYPEAGINNILFNDIKITITDENEKEIDLEDFEFKSYVNKKVKADFREVKLYCVSANEEECPAGKGNILKKTAYGHELQLSFTRAGQTDCLERLLMRTIHSNYTAKSRLISVDVEMSKNPIMRVVTYNPIIDSPGMLVSGCKLDFGNATTHLTAYDFSADTANLSSIPYED